MKLRTYFAALTASILAAGIAAEAGLIWMAGAFALLFVCLGFASIGLELDE